MCPFLQGNKNFNFNLLQMFSSNGEEYCYGILTFLLSSTTFAHNQVDLLPRMIKHLKKLDALGTTSSDHEGFKKCLRFLIQVRVSFKFILILVPTVIYNDSTFTWHQTVSGKLLHCYKNWYRYKQPLGVLNNLFY